MTKPKAQSFKTTFKLINNLDLGGAVARDLTLANNMPSIELFKAPKLDFEQVQILRAWLRDWSDHHQTKPTRTLRTKL